MGLPSALREACVYWALLKIAAVLCPERFLGKMRRSNLMHLKRKRSLASLLLHAHVLSKDCFDFIIIFLLTPKCKRWSRRNRVAFVLQLIPMPSFLRRDWRLAYDNNSHKFCNLIIEGEDAVTYFIVSHTLKCTCKWANSCEISHVISSSNIIIKLPNADSSPNSPQLWEKGRH